MLKISYVSVTIMLVDVDTTDGVYLAKVVHETTKTYVLRYLVYKKRGLYVYDSEEEVEKSLEILDERYSSISKVLEIPLFFDSPEVRRVVEDVGICRKSILQVAQALGNVEEG